ncbi:MAG TPA: glycosyltransferase family A protein [Holophagaceae bacterium]|nr:glycosyltransferase family A protein [Holophagaceae bacterium]
MKVFAPIAVFGFNRPQHLERTLQSLAANPEAADTPIHLFCDGPRGPEDEALVAEVHALMDRFAEGRRAATVHKSPVNLGLAASITQGVARILEDHDRFIVVEDDLVLSPHFLKFMNEALEAYRDRPEVGCVTGYMYPVPLREPKAVLLPFVTSWGWGTWGDRWKDFNPDGRSLAREIARQGRRREFDLNGSFHMWGMLQDQVHGYNSSWWIRWQATLFLKGSLTVWPGMSLLLNKGMDGTGTHCGPQSHLEGLLADRPIEVDGTLTAPSSAYMEAIQAFLAPHRHSDFMMAIRRRVPKRFFARVLRPMAHRLARLRGGAEG